MKKINKTASLKQLINGVNTAFQTISNKILLYEFSTDMYYFFDAFSAYNIGILSAKCSILYLFLPHEMVLLKQLYGE